MNKELPITLDNLPSEAMTEVMECARFFSDSISSALETDFTSPNVTILIITIRDRLFKGLDRRLGVINDVWRPQEAAEFFAAHSPVYREDMGRELFDLEKAIITNFYAWQGIPLMPNDLEVNRGYYLDVLHSQVDTWREIVTGAEYQDFRPQNMRYSVVRSGS